MSDKDGKSKEFLKVNERFADAFNYYMYNGEQVIKPENLEERDVTEVLTVYGIDPNVTVHRLACNKKGDKTNMCKAWEDHRKSGIIEGRI